MADKTWAETALDAVSDSAKGWFNIITSSVDRALNFSPTVEDEVIVEVVGQPGASKQQLYFLALTAANGIIRRFVPLGISNPPAAGMLMIEYDAADHWIRCTMMYKQSTFQLSAEAFGGMNRTKWFDQMSIYRGPQCAVIGGAMDFIDKDLPGIPRPGTFPTFPFEGRTILTPCPTVIDPVPGPTLVSTPPVPFNKPGNPIFTPNPKPPGDNRSRGAIVTNPDGFTDPNACCEQSLKLIPLVFASLSDPGSFGNETFTPPIQGPGGG